MHLDSDIIIFRTDSELKRQFQAICNYHRTTMTRELTKFITEYIRSKSVEKRKNDEEFEDAFGLPVGFGPYDDGGEVDW